MHLLLFTCKTYQPASPTGHTAIQSLHALRIGSSSIPFRGFLQILPRHKGPRRVTESWIWLPHCYCGRQIIVPGIRCPSSQRLLFQLLLFHIAYLIIRMIKVLSSTKAEADRFNENERVSISAILRSINSIGWRRLTSSSAWRNHRQASTTLRPWDKASHWAQVWDTILDIYPELIVEIQVAMAERDLILQLPLR